MTKENKAFYQGVAVMAWAIIDLHDEPSMVQDTLKSMGITRQMLEEADADANDLVVIYEDHFKNQIKRLTGVRK